MRKEVLKLLVDYVYGFVDGNIKEFENGYLKYLDEKGVEDWDHYDVKINANYNSMENEDHHLVLVVSIRYLGESSDMIYFSRDTLMETFFESTMNNNKDGATEIAERIKMYIDYEMDKYHTLK